MNTVMTRHSSISNGKLDTEQVHQLIRLLAEAREIPAEEPQREQHLMSGLARIIDAAVASVILDTKVMAGRRDQHSAIMLVGWDSTTLRSLEVLGPAGSAFISIVRAMMRVTPTDPGATVTATWHELVTDQAWCGAEHVEQSLDPAGLARPLFSGVRLRTTPLVHGLGLYREPEECPFSDEERNLVHVFHAEYEILLSALPRNRVADEQARARLSPRQRQTLDLVLGGLCDKEIAGRLGISRYTVNQYTKAIYRHYAVTSRAQLLAHLLAQPNTAHSLIVGIGSMSIAP